MFESVRQRIALSAVAFLVMGTALERDALANDGRRRVRESPGAEKWTRGQHGGDLRLLRSFHTPPSGEGESNHYFDLWDPGSLAVFARVQGLTNNRALIIDSHGTDHLSWRGIQYVFRPSATAVKPGVGSGSGSGSAGAGVGVGVGADRPSYSIRDIAVVMGPDAAARIHNIVIAGCNEGGRLKSADFRRHFVNATNVIHMDAGSLSYKPIFYQALVRHSEDIQPFYGLPVQDGDQRTKVQIYRTPVEGSTPLGFYVADLFKPGAAWSARPYRRQRAGRELLEPGFPRSSRLRAEWLQDLR